MNKLLIKKHLSILLIMLLSVIAQGCNKNMEVQEQGSYAAALYWNDVLYEPSAGQPIDKSLINSEIGM